MIKALKYSTIIGLLGISLGLPGQTFADSHQSFRLYEKAQVHLKAKAAEVTPVKILELLEENTEHEEVQWYIEELFSCTTCRDRQNFVNLYNSGSNLEEWREHENITFDLTAEQVSLPENIKTYCTDNNCITVNCFTNMEDDLYVWSLEIKDKNNNTDVVYLPSISSKIHNSVKLLVLEDD